MVGYQSTSLLDRLVAGCFGLLAAAIALYIAVRLIESIWIALVVIGICVAAVGGLIIALRWHREGW